MWFWCIFSRSKDWQRSRRTSEQFKSRVRGGPVRRPLRWPYLYRIFALLCHGLTSDQWADTRNSKLLSCSPNRWSIILLTFTVVTCKNIYTRRLSLDLMSTSLLWSNINILKCVSSVVSQACVSSACVSSACVSSVCVSSVCLKCVSLSCVSTVVSQACVSK